MYCSLQEAWPDYQFGNNTNQESNVKNNIQMANKHVNIIENNDSATETKNNTNIYTLSKNEYEEYQRFLHNKTNKNNIAIEHFTLDDKIESHVNSLKCNDVLNHVHNCDICLRHIYKRYNCLGNREHNMFNMLSKDQKDIISVILVGILVILILQMSYNR